MKELIKKVSEELKITIPEAELVVATLLEEPRFEIYLKEAPAEEVTALLGMKVQQLKHNVPLEYLTKKIQFFDYQLKIRPGVFIPRLETEYLLELIKQHVQFPPRKILEIGIGCGAIAIGLAQIFEKAQIIGTDISAIALANAAENIEALNRQSQITLIRADLFDGLNTSFDLIVSNPPYIPTGRLQYLPESVKHFEPLCALDGGPDGLRFIKRLIDSGLAVLAPGGLLAIEIDEDTVVTLKEYLTTKSCHFSFKKDLFNTFRYLFVSAQLLPKES